MVSFIHTADWHLGMQAHFLPEEARARFAQDRFDGVRRIGELAQEHDCAFVVVAGDVFDSNHVDRRVIANAIEALSSFTVPVFLLPGNHDPLDPSSVFRASAWLDHKPANAYVIEKAAATAVPGRQPAEVVGCPWHTKHQLGDPIAACYEVEPCLPGAIRVIVGHGIVDELSPEADDPAFIRAATMRDAIKEGRAHYIALGDRHSVTDIPGAEGRACYSGTPVATAQGEIDPNNALLITLDADACRVEPLAVGGWHFMTEARDLAGKEDVRALEQWLEAVPSKHTTVLRLLLRGTLNLGDSALLEEVLERNRLTFASLNTWERHSDLVIAPDGSDLADLDIAGYARGALEGLREEAEGSGEEAVVARDALNLLYRLAR